MSKNTLAFPPVLALLACAGSLSAATLIVGKPGTPCPGAKYSTIAAAINAAAPDDVVEICPALYPEQLTISKAMTLRGLQTNGIGRVLIQPTVLSPSVSFDAAAGDAPVEAVISVVNTSRVQIESLAIDATNNGASGCLPVVTGVHFYNSSGQISDSAIYGAQVTGCAGAGALLVGSGTGVLIDADQKGRFQVTAERNSIHDFTRNGIQAIGAGVTAQLCGNTITGQGPVGGVFQFGIFILNQAVGLISDNMIHEGSCGSLSSDACYAARSEGVTLRAVGDGTVVDHNTITTAQSGIFINGGSHARITNNFISDIDYLDGIDIEGSAAGVFSDSLIAGNTITNLGPVENYSCGIFEYPATGVAGNTISANTVSDGYCGVGSLSTDRHEAGTYINTLYKWLDSSLPNLPTAIEP